MERKWEELGVDCLANVFEKLEIQDLTLGIPFVCKNWYKASADPHCWKILDFSILNFNHRGPFASEFNHQYRMQNFSVAGLMKFALDRGGEHVVKLLLPSTCELDSLVYASNKCARLKILVLPFMLVKSNRDIIPTFLSDEDREQFFGLVPKWKELEHVHIREYQSYTNKLLSEISCHCENFIGLKRTGLIEVDEALAIVNHLPKLKHLTLTSASLSRENFMMILEGCKELEELVVKDCCGFEVDEEILKMTSRIMNFKCEDLRLEEDDRFYYPSGYLFPDTSDDSDVEFWECPKLKILGLPSLHHLVKRRRLIPMLRKDDMQQFFGLFTKWKDLEYLHVQSCKPYMGRILLELSCHCKNFIGLETVGYLMDEEALAIVNHLPGLKHLILNSVSMSRKSFKMILEGCKELEEVVIIDWSEFQSDEEILRMTSHIKNFKYEALGLEQDKQGACLESSDFDLSYFS